MKTAFFFDLDGTITTTELLPCIASELGVADEIATLTRLTMDGLIPFTDSMRLRCLILGQVPLERAYSVVDSIPMQSELVDFINSRPEQCAVVTGNLDIWLQPLMERLACRWFCSSATISSGCVRLNHIIDKGQVVRESRASGKFERHVAIGDGANDVSMLSEAEIGIAYGAVHPPAPCTVDASTLLVNSPEALCKLLKAL